MTKNQSNMVKWIVAATAIAGLLWALSADPFKWYHMVAIPLCMWLFIIYIGHVIKGK